MNRLSKSFINFFQKEQSTGILLILCTLISLIIANSPVQIFYLEFWEMPVRLQFGDFNFFNFHEKPLTFETFINEALMAVFFLSVGLEIKREIYAGELANLKKALLPIMGALGGMIIPAFIYMLFNYGTQTQSGAGIPMATDIAFALGVLSLLGKKVPVALKVFLTALAVIDDFGAIVVIALFYTLDLSVFHLSIALMIWGVLLFLNKVKIYSLIPYLVGGIIMWYFMLNSGVHATISGVLLAFAIPFQKGEKKVNFSKLQHSLHRPVNYIILPLFALANTAIVVNSDIQNIFTQSYSQGIFFGLFLGKPLGIMLFSILACVGKISKLPEGVLWKQMLGVGFLGGIGFTMSIFITLLAFDPISQQDYINHAKFIILTTSLCSAFVGYFYLKKILFQNHSKITN